MKITVPETNSLPVENAAMQYQMLLKRLKLAISGQGKIYTEIRAFKLVFDGISDLRGLGRGIFPEKLRSHSQT